MKIILFLTLFIATFTQASPLIIVKDKGGVSAFPYYKKIGLLNDQTTSTLSAPSMPSSMDESTMLPIKSQYLRVGKVSPRAFKAPGLTPIFLIGSDDFSKRWLVQRYNDLKRIGAIGFVVQVKTLPELNHLRSIAPDLTLSPISGDDIAKRLQLKHYPVLISSTVIEQ